MGTALGYAVSSRGGDYNNIYASLEYSWSKEQAVEEFGTASAVDIHATEAKGRLICKAVVTNILVDALGLCKVPVLSMLKSFNLKPESNWSMPWLNGSFFQSTDRHRAGHRGNGKRFNLRHAETSFQMICRRCSLLLKTTPPDSPGNPWQPCERNSTRPWAGMKTGYLRT